MTQHRLTELPSGLRVVTERMDGVRSASLGFYVHAGSRGETVEEAGLSHFLEHLLFKARTATSPCRSTGSSTAGAPSSTPAPTRSRRRSTRACWTTTSGAP